MNYKTRTCAPTNVSVVQVASRVLRLVKDFVIRLTNVDCAFKEMECEIVKLEEGNRDLVLSIRKHEESQASNSSSSKRYRTSLKHLKVRLSSWRNKTKSCKPREAEWNLSPAFLLGVPSMIPYFKHFSLQKACGAIIQAVPLLFPTTSSPGLSCFDLCVPS
ncbi:hypothetical protein Tco_1025771 [Tanacetum coccineum]